MYPQPRRNNSFWSVHRVVLAGCAGIAGGIFLMALLAARPPGAFPVGERVEIPPGTSLVDSTRILADAHAVRSAVLLQMLLLGSSTHARVQAGTYIFEQPLSMREVADAITSGAYGDPFVRITVPEGFSNEQIDAVASERLDRVEPGEILRLAEGKEGYLFPDTYHVPETFTASDLVALMEATFREQLDELRADIERSGRTERDIVIMASILEREANDEESMRLVSGILWDRIDIGMPLQVDASFSYLLGKASDELTVDDLAMDSPYNTYTNLGLTPTPISNPGRMAIEAAIHPISSPYLFYLTAPDGVFHYARTFEDHRDNKFQYLR